MRRQRWVAYSLSALVLLLGGVMVFRHLLGFHYVAAQAEPYALPEQGFDYYAWGKSLAAWVEDGKVDYLKVVEEQQALRRFVATLAEVGPRSTPERFPNDQHKLAFYINAYNALTLLGVVHHWPINTVHDVKGWLEPKAGFGFFYGLSFLLDGERINLYDLEHRIIRSFGDARIHAAINCASVSCPDLQAYAYVPTLLEEQLDSVTRAFCSSPKHVAIDDEARELRLSSIFEWFRSDFENHVSRLGKGESLYDFIELFGDEARVAELRRVREVGYGTSFVQYDWNLNQK